jgi:hypothetical protein
VSVVKSERRRWFVLLTGLALTIAAIVFGPAPAEVVEVAAARPPAAPALVAPQAAAGEVAPIFAEEGIANPFEKRGWEEPPPAPAVVAEPIVVAPLAVAQEEPKGPPPLPFKYIGRFSDDAGGLVYLARGEQTLVARVGDTLEGNYKLTALETRRIEFENIESGTKQTLPVPEAE